MPTTTEVEILQTKVKLLKPSVKTITLNVSDTEPGIYTVKVTVLSRHDNTVKDIIETRTIVIGNVSPELLINSPKIYKSAVIKSSIDNATINISAIKNSIINDSTITGSIVNNCRVDSTPLNDVIVEDARIVSGIIRSGNITINEIKYEISNETRISDLILGSDHRDSNLVGIKNEKTLKVPAENTNVSFDIYAKKDYFAGSMSVQKSSVPPDGVAELTNNVGGYVYTNVSDNLNDSAGWRIIKVYYDQNELGAIDESTLKLRYFNETADAPGWEDIPLSGINHMENYVWGNISHFSVFALVAQPPVDGGRDGGIRHLPEEITLLIANLGINIFNFEWLGHDITKVSIDLKSMKINAKVALKKVDKPAEFPDPPGIVYGYFDISTNIEPEKIHASKIHFKILKSWTVFKDVNVETIKLWRYANGWEELETAKIKEDDNHLHFCAETKCFSLIAITSEKRALDVTPTAPTPTAPAPKAPTAPTPTPPSESPEPPVDRAPISLTGRLIIVAIVALAIAVSVTYLLLRRRKT
jgi:PGF-pre-PGF domain-containing protein